MAAIDARQLLTQVGLDAAHRLEVEPQLIALAFALAQHAGLFGQSRFKFGHAPAENLGLGCLHGQLVLELPDPFAQLLHLPALERQLLRGGFGGAALLFEPPLGVFDRLVQVGDLMLERIDLRLERHDLHALAVGRHPPLVEIAGQARELRLFVGQRPFGLAQRVGLGRQLVLGRVQLIFERLIARLEGKDGRGFLPDLCLELIDDVGLLAQLGELARGLALELVDAHLEPPGRHGELGAQLVLVRLDFRHRYRNRRFQPARGEPLGPAVNERHDDEREQGCGQKAEPEIHDRLDHGRTPPTQLPGGKNTMPRGRREFQLPRRSALRGRPTGRQNGFQVARLVNLR